MVQPWKSPAGRAGAQDSSSGWHGELVELAALFLAVALADLFANMLVHRPLGPLVLTGLGMSLLVCAVVRRWWTNRSARSSTPRQTHRASHPSGNSPGTVPGRNLWRVRTAVRDTPGSLAALAAGLASHRLNILSIQVHAMAEGAVDEFLVEAPADTAWRDVVAATESGGGRDVHADRADMHDLVDVPTRVLMVAAQSTGMGVQLPAALRMLLGASTLCRRDRIGGDSDARNRADEMDGITMRLYEPEGGLLTLQRPALPFTPAEFARARALRDLNLRLRDHRAAADTS